jgi:hypothetical protein
MPHATAPHRTFCHSSTIFDDFYMRASQLKIVDEVFLCELIARIAHTLPDFKRNVAARKQS